MVKKMFTTEGPARLSVFFLAAAVLAAGTFACSGEEKPPAEVRAVVASPPSLEGEESHPEFN